MPKKKYFTEEEKKEAKRKTNREYQRRKNKTIIGRASYLLSSYNKNDRKYNRGKGDLTIEWIVENIFSQPCKHCGKTGWDKIGCNRLDNSKPHTMDNVEPCCEECNNDLAGEEKKITLGTVIYQYTIDDELVGLFQSAKEAAKETHYDLTGITQHSKGGYYRNGKWYEIGHIYKDYKWYRTPL